VNTCEACEQFKKRIKEWNYWSGAIDPTPYINEMIKPHKYLIFEGRRLDGAGRYVLVFQCLKCVQWWKISAWPVFGCLEVSPLKERRQYERFMFPIPVRIETLMTVRKKVLDLVTRDISVSGIFITTLTSFPERTRFILDFTIPTDSIKGLKDKKSLRGYTGNMVRSTSYGIAINFDRECQIESLKAL
jgi:hypothetical protein